MKIKNAQSVELHNAVGSLTEDKVKIILVEEVKEKPISDAKAGELALRVEKAGFHTIGLVEFDRDACDTLEKSRPEWRVICDDIVNISKLDLKEHFGIKKGELD